VSEKTASAIGSGIANISGVSRRGRAVMIRS
jgi:hypothetical protein